MSEQTHSELAAVAAGSITFRCNICGGSSTVLSAELERERPSCTECGSTLRWRSLVHLVSKEIHGRDLCLADLRALLVQLGWVEEDAALLGFIDGRQDDEEGLFLGRLALQGEELTACLDDADVARWLAVSASARRMSSPS